MRKIDNERPTAAPGSGPAGSTGTGTGFTGVVLGWLSGFTAEGRPLVEVPDRHPGVLLPARAAGGLSRAHVGRQVALVFEGGDVDRPIVLGVLEALPAPADPGESGRVELPLEVEVDKKRIVLEADQEIVLRCGESSITLHRDGKITVKGDRILTRARTTNRIKGGSVQIN